MVGDFDENFQEFDVCNAISTLAYCFFKLLSSLVRFIPRCLGPHWAVYQIHDQAGDPIGEEIRLEFTVEEQT